MDDSKLGPSLGDLGLVPTSAMVKSLDSTDGEDSESLAQNPERTSTTLEIPEDLSTDKKVAKYLGNLMPALGQVDLVSVVVPWLCNVCPSDHSRKAYLTDISNFVRHMAVHDIHPLQVTGDEVSLYKDALRKSGYKATSIAQMLSVLRGMYQQFGKKGLVNWETVGGIQAVESPKVKKNTTPALSEQEAKDLLHTPNTATMVGCRDHALLFTLFRTGCRTSAIAYATVGDLERTDTNWYLMVTEKGEKQERKALLDATPAVLKWITRSGIANDPDAPLFPAIERDRKTPAGRHITTRQILNIVKKYAKKAGIQVERKGRRSICTHSTRKSAITNALEHGAPMHLVQAFAGHASVRTTELYYEKKEKDAEDAAKYIQIR